MDAWVRWLVGSVIALALCLAIVLWLVRVLFRYARELFARVGTLEQDAGLTSGPTNVHKVLWRKPRKTWRQWWRKWVAKLRKKT